MTSIMSGLNPAGLLPQQKRTSPTETIVAEDLGRMFLYNRDEVVEILVPVTGNTPLVLVST